LAAALGDDENFATTVTTNLALKAPLASPALTGNPTAPTQSSADSSTKIATTAYVNSVTVAPSNLSGVITSSGAVTTITSQTGTGSKFVVDTSPTLVTPVLGVATATSINSTTIPSSKTLVATDSTTYVVPSQTSNSGKFLTTDGTTSSWGAIAGSLAQPSEPSSPNDGQIWIDTDGAVVGQAVTRWSKAPTGGTTSLTGLDDSSVTLSYTAGYEQVYRNGTLLSRGNDYTATNGTSITLIDATLTGDIIEVIGSSVLAIADVYTQAQSNSNYIGKALTTTTGDMIYASAANTPARLGIGSTDQILKVSGGVPVWAAPASAAPTSASARVTTGQSSSSATYADLATAGPAVTVTTGTKAMVIVGARVQASAGWNGNMSYAVSGATTVSANDEWSIMSFDSYSQQFSFASTQVSLTAGSNTFTAKYKTGSADNPCTFSNRYIIVIDLGS